MGKPLSHTLHASPAARLKSSCFALKRSCRYTCFWCRSFACLSPHQINPGGLGNFLGLWAPIFGQNPKCSHIEGYGGHGTISSQPETGRLPSSKMELLMGNTLVMDVLFGKPMGTNSSNLDLTNGETNTS